MNKSLRWGIGLLAIVSALAQAAPLPLQNTGNNGGLLPDGSVDPNYTLIVSPDPSFPGPNAFVTDSTQFPIPPWVADGPNSKWISPRVDAGNNNSQGNYTYRYSFSLIGFDPATAQITGTWATDNGGTDILLNGVSISPTPTPDAAFQDPMGTYTFSMPVGSNFNACSNTLDFVLNNAGTSPNPTGIRIELTGSATPNSPISVLAGFAPSPITVGGVSTLTFTLTNAAGNSAQSCFGFSNTLPAGVTVSGAVSAAQCGGTVTQVGDVTTLANGTLPAGASSCTVTLNVTSNVVGSYPDTDAANISARSGNIDTSGVDATLVVIAIPQADLATTATVPPTAAAGSTVNIPIVFTNNGPSSASNVATSATLPAGLSGVVVSNGGSYNSGTGAITWPLVATLANGASLNYSVSYTAPATGSVAFTATVSSATNDPNPGNNTASGTTTITASADLATTATVPPTATAAATVNIPIVFTNNGPSAASNVNASATLPAGLGGVVVSNGGSYNSGTGTITWPVVANLASGATLNYSVSYTAPATGSVAFTATVSSATSDPNPGNNTASGTTVISASADLVTTVNVPANAIAGTTVTIPVTFTNTGPSTASNVSASATLPPGLTGVVVSNGGSYNSATGAITWPLVASLANGASLDYTVGYTAPASGSVIFTATVTSTTPDPTPGNNTRSAATTIGAAVSAAPIPTLTPIALVVLIGMILFVAIRRRT